MTIVAAQLAQVLAGLPVDDGMPTTCCGCGRALHEGALVALAVDHIPGTARWTVSNRYCTDCGFDGGARTASSVFLATLGRASDASTQSTWSIAIDPVPIAAPHELDV